jgi:membrane-bound inhibitor of C-type lysozyme
MIRQTFVALALAGAAVSAASAAHAAQLTVEEIDADARQPTVYQCANEKQPLRVSYWRAGNGQSFALVPVNGQQMLFVDTVSGSGVRYQAGRYTWWTKGRRRRCATRSPTRMPRRCSATACRSTRRKRRRVERCGVAGRRGRLIGLARRGARR